MKTVVNLLLLVLAITASIYNALIFTQLWEWFIVPAFGVEPIMVTTAIAIGLLTSLMFGKRSIAPPGEDETEFAFYNVLFSFVRTTLVVFFGYILTFFV